MIKLNSLSRLLVGILLLVVACSSSGDADKLSKPREAQDSKISPKIEEMVQTLKSAENAGKSNASALSTSLVKVDDNANIQCYIYLTEVNSENLEQIKNRVSKVDLVNQDLKIIQAWIPHTDIQAIANFDFVTKITPPDYGRKLQDQN